MKAFNDYLEMAGKKKFDFDEKDLAEIIFDSANEIDHEDYEEQIDQIMATIRKELNLLIDDAHVKERYMRGDK